MIADRVAGFLAGCVVTVRPVLDPAQLAPVDSRAIPEGMRLAVCTRNPVDVFPYGIRRSRACDLDHTVPFDPQAPPGAGQTRLDNLGPLSRYAHRVKTHGGWRLEQPAPGVFAWTSPVGYRYVVTAAGTVQTHRPDPPSRPWWYQEPPDDEDPPDPDDPPEQIGLWPARTT